MINSLGIACKDGLKLVFEVLLLPFLAVWALISRFHNRPIDVGIGPEPIVTHQLHKHALERQGYSAETYATYLYFITSDFDITPPPHALLRRIFPFLLLFRILWRYRCLYFYFNGGILGMHTRWIWRIEPWLYQLAGIKIVVTAYGSDVQDLSRTPNLLYKAAMSIDYPNFRRRRRRVARNIDTWTSHANCIIGGCDWVDYMYHWDVLIPAHFCVDTDHWQPLQSVRNSAAPLRVLHAPNHRAIKGTRHFERAVEELKAEGVPIELIVIEKVPHEQLKRIMETVDVVADQLIIGWYGNFAVEGMAMGKTTLAYLRQDLIELFEANQIIDRDEIPIINTTVFNVKQVLRDLALHRETLAVREAHSRAYAIKYHSIDAIGAVFERVNQHIGLTHKEN